LRVLGRRVALASLRLARITAAIMTASACGHAASEGGETPGGLALVSSSGEIPMGAIAARGPGVAAASAHPRAEPAPVMPSAKRPPPQDPFADPPEPPPPRAPDAGTHGGTTL
jgi:hypothetical protein